MSKTEQCVARNFGLSNDHYTVERNLTEDKYQALDDSGDVVLECRKTTFAMRETFRFVDGGGEERIEAQQVRDCNSRFVLTDAKTGEDFAVLDHEASPFEQVTGATWSIRDAGTDAVVATITSRKLAGLFRTGVFGNLIPHRYAITDAKGEHVGTIAGRLSVRDTYEIEMAETSTVPVAPILAAVMIIDDIEGS